MSTIYILWLRQLKRYVRSRSRLIGSLGQPVLYLVALGFGFGPIYAKAGGGDYISFLAPGVMGMGIIFTAMFGGMEILWDRQFGFLKETLVAPVPRFNIMLGRTLGGATVAMIQGCIIFVMALIAGFRPESLSMIPVAIVYMFLTSFVFTAFGTGIACLLQDFQGFQLIMNFLVMPLFFLSGALFPLEGLPAAINIVARIDPLAYGIDALRGTLINASHFGLATDTIVLVGFVAIFMAIGSWLFSRIQA